MEILTEQVNELLNRIHYYYPIGQEQLGTNHPGYIDYNKILTSKINNIIEDKKSNWDELTKLIMGIYKDGFFDMNYLQFPSHIGKIALKNELHQEYDYQQTLVINISLLCNFYTIFFEDTFIYKNYIDPLPKPKTKILYLNQKKKIEINHTIEIIQQKIKWLFPEYEYINHKVLFLYEIKAGVPYTDGYEYATPPYFIYNFLFDGFFKEQCYYTLE